MEEIERIVRKYPERFTEEEKRQIKAAVSGRSSGYEIRQCDVCGSYMNMGHYFEDGSHYCSEECMRKDGISEKDQTAYYYGLEPAELSEEVKALPLEDFTKYCEENGSEDESIGYYTEWESPMDLIYRLNQCRKELLESEVNLPEDREEVLEGFFSYWKEEVLPLYEEDGAILESFEDALGNESAYRNVQGFMSWREAIKEVTK